jgi:hypothetical protein
MFKKIISRLAIAFTAGGIALYLIFGAWLSVLKGIVDGIIEHPFMLIPYAIIAVLCIIFWKIGCKIGTWIKNH